MKKIILIILCIASCLLVSCDTKSELTSIDFGSAEFEEPFRGLLASHPSWLVATLDWPILRSLKSDTIVLSKSVKLEFNEDAVRSNSSAYIVFGNKNGNREHHAYQFFCNDELVGADGYRVQATTEPQELSIKVKIHPAIGDSTELGYLSIYGNEIDEVNSIALTEEGWQRIAQWSFTQEIGLPWLIWLIWLLLLLIAVAIIVLVIYLLIQYVIIPLGAFLSNVSLPTLSMPTFAWPTLNFRRKQKSSHKQKRKVDTTEQKQNNEQENEELDPYIQEALRLESMLRSTEYGIASKNDILEQLREHLAKTFYTDRELNERCYQTLQVNTQKALDKFNSFVGETPKNGTWTGERGQSLFKLSQLNIHYAKCKSLGFIACKYTSFEPDFTPVTWPKSVVDISDLYAIYSCAELEKRGGTKSSFQYRAQMRIAKRIDPELREWWKKNRKQEEYDQEAAFWAWRNANDLLPHEDANCRTLRLVKRSAHMAFTHAGGIAHAKVIKDYFM